jgi:hypothetical protein
VAVQWQAQEYTKAAATLIKGLSGQDARLNGILMGKTLVLYRPLQRFILEQRRHQGRGKAP